MVTMAVEVQGASASTMLPALLNWAQSPDVNDPPPNHRFDPCRVHVLFAVQIYRFRPAEAAVLKKVAPTEQVDGSAVPVWNGLVDAADEKSMFLAWVLRSTKVWPYKRVPLATNIRNSQ
jgi:hypothetical protein